MENFFVNFFSKITGYSVLINILKKALDIRRDVSVRTSGVEKDDGRFIRKFQLRRLQTALFEGIVAFSEKIKSTDKDDVGSRQETFTDTPPSAHFVRIHLPLTQRPSFYKLA